MTCRRSGSATWEAASTSIPWIARWRWDTSYLLRWNSKRGWSPIRVVTEYINRIGQNLVRNSDARVPFTIKVLDNDEVNAFALPGGFFYVDSGLILAADNEAELAGVMAHEIAHVAARHATKNMTRAQIWNMASVPLIFIGGPVAYAISEVAGLAVPLGFLKFSRDAEREADLLGLEYDYASGYDPEAFVEFFEKLKVNENKKQSFVAKAFATHPMNADRIKAAQDEIRKYLPDRDEYVVNTSEFEEVKQRLASLENSRRLGGGKRDPSRPVLHRRSASRWFRQHYQLERRWQHDRSEGRWPSHAQADAFQLALRPLIRHGSELRHSRLNCLKWCL